MKKRSLFISILLLLAITLVACNGDNTSSQSTNNESADTKLKIYTTIFPLEDFTKKIGGDLVEVENVLPPGSDAHTYEPTTKMMVDIANADGFIYSGVGIESFAAKIEKSLEKEDVAFINAGNGIDLLEHEHSDEKHSEDEAAHEHEDEAHSEDEAAHEHEDEAHSEEEESHKGHDHGDKDPHVWLDPVLSITLAENIKNSLVELNPDGKETFEKNFQQVKAQLKDLDKSFTDVVSNGEKREILVSHAAYGYWEDRYGIEQISVLGLSPTEEPSQKELQNIIETAKEHDIQYIIFEANVSSDITDIVQSEIGAEALTLNNLESLTEEDKNNNEDYFSIMKKNLETIEKALSSK
ncbi:metal ABC transporter solute-binding protein, Zn/Mn family [Metabacillus sediminilitoris]|uniref:Adhesin n=1 Tax=Metabacillus sediminilitoris TaxID=2567941 RepID=A0A4S4C3H9_9BACI|nr:zinc ABC transporter substrate-binding protein [Metabacillus sediminilitoris]QGQ47627.1 adhesin [Metabacillus sediminilitoris]THF82061.1 adhesin [Metabacillus sediminilitoris]